IGLTPKEKSWPRKSSALRILLRGRRHANLLLTSTKLLIRESLPEILGSKIRFTELRYPACRISQRALSADDPQNSISSFQWRKLPVPSYERSSMWRWTSAT